MPVPWALSGWGDFLSLIVCVLGVFALTKYIFASFISAEFFAWWFQSLADDRRAAQILRWELQKNAHYDEDVARGSPHAAPVTLTANERARRELELKRLTRGTLGRRAGQYFLTCFMCQSFWVALMCIVASGWAMSAARDPLGIWGTFFAACCYGGIATALNARLGTATPAEQATERHRPHQGCRGAGCGGK